MGTYRLILALFVVLSHTDITVMGFNPGVVAVVSFFLLSGFVMTRLIDQHYASSSRVLDFYIDRAGRLFPQFFFYLFATLMLVVTVYIPSPFLAGCTPGKWMLNTLLLPLGYSKYFGLKQCLAIPPAWSLGLELTFYLVFPFLILNPRAMIWSTVGSCLIFGCAYIGIINTDLFGYRLLPGTLFIFIVGFALARLAIWRFLPPLVWLVAAALFVTLFFFPRLLHLHYSKEVLLGILLGVPIVAVLSRRRYSSLDDMLGNLSYGVFLNHFFLIWAMAAVGITIVELWHWLILITASVALSFVSFVLVERPVLRWRHHLRRGLEGSKTSQNIAEA